MASTILPLVERFRPAFSKPSFTNFRFLLLAWLMNPKRGWLSNCLRCVLHLPDLAPTNNNNELKHFSCFYNFFTVAVWSKDNLGHLLAGSLERWLPDKLTLIVDDTLCRRSGPMVLGAGMHHDPLRTTTRGSGRTEFSFGLNFVICAVWIPVGFVHSGGIAVPLLFRLYRSKKTCPEESYQKRTELAAELLTIVRSWWPDRNFEVCVDDEYVCETVLNVRDDQMVITGAFQFRYVLYHPDKPVWSGKGRPPKWGPKLGKVAQLRDDDDIPWQEVTAIMYGREVSLLVKTIEARWSSSGPDDVVTILITRDPTGFYDDTCFIRTESEASVQSILTPVCRRWSLEVTIRDSKQHLHIEQIENGYAHRDEPVQTHRKERPGPQAPVEKEPVASRRTTPLFMLSFGVVVWWYLQHGDSERDIKWAKFIAPWWRQKTTISFGDMLQALRRQMEKEDLWTNPPQQGFDEKYLRNLPFDWPQAEIPGRQIAQMTGKTAKL
jgi:hypothetical protein